MDDAIANHVEYAAMAERLARGGIDVPPVYTSVADALRERGDLMFATRDLPAPLYQAGAYITEFTNGLVVEDYTAIGIDGYGNFSVYFHYYMVRGKFGLFVQLPVQSHDGNDAPLIAAINAHLSDVETLLASPPPGPLAIIDVIDLQTTLTGSSLDALTGEPSDNPLSNFLNSRANRDSEAVIMNI